MHFDKVPPIADYIIKNVPIGLLSNSIFTPDLPLRTTQPTIGYFLDKKKSIAESTYGVHKSEYGGTGKTKHILGEHDHMVARKTQHLRTALHSMPETPMVEKIRIRKTVENKEFFAGPINKVAWDIFNQFNSARSKPLPISDEKQLFPRSVVYEIDYMKELYQKAMTEALEKERKEFEELIRKQKATLEMKELEAKSHLYEKAQKEFIQVEQNEEIKTEGTIAKEKTKEKNILEENTALRDAKLESMKEENKIAESYTSICGPCRCILAQGNCPTYREKTKPKLFQLGNEMKPNFKNGSDCPKWETQLPKFFSSWGSQRQPQMTRVNYPFKTEAARWHYCSVPPFEKSKGLKPSKKRFLEKGFSSLNI